jgi:cytochrome c biogenesis protein CcdA
VAWILTLGVLAAAVMTASVVGPSGGGLAVGVATLSARATDALQFLGDQLPLGYAFAAGMAATVNPCGFALLPGYLGLYLSSRVVPRSSARLLGLALVVAGTMTASFVALFGLVGLALGVAATLLGNVLPWVGVLVGVLLTLVGGVILGGGSVAVPLAGRLEQPLGGLARQPRLIGYAAYGAAFALASLGCTLPLFLSVVATTLTVNTLGMAVLRFVLYGLGMGVVVTGATLLTALCGQALVARIGAIGRFFGPVSAILLVLSGAYVVYYWLTVGGLLG